MTDVTKSLTARISKRHLCFLTLFILVGIGLRVAHWNPGYASDDTNYMNNAAELLKGESPFIRNNHTARLGYQLFLAVGMRIFGVSTTVSQALGLGVFVGVAILLFYFTVALGGANAGLMAAFLYVVLPIDIVVSTAVLPDVLMTMLAMAGSILYLKAVSAEKQIGMYSVSCGIVWGLAVSVKEPAIFFPAAMAIHLAATLKYSRKSLRIFTGIAVGGFLVMVLDSIGLLLWTGDALYRVHITTETFAPDGLWGTNPFSINQATKYLRIASNSWGDYGLHGYLVLIGVLLAIHFRNGKLFFPILVTVLLTIYLSVGSASVTRYIMVPHHSRYFLPVLVMGFTIAAIGLEQLRSVLRFEKWLVLVVALVLTAVSLWAAKEMSWRGTIPMAAWLAAKEPDDRRRFVILDTLLPRLPLEYRDAIEGVGVIKESDLLSGRILKSSLAGRGIVVDRFKLLASGEKSELRPWEERLMVNDDVEFKRETVYGETWPPYKKWLGIGNQKMEIGRIWWAARQ